MRYYSIIEKEYFHRRLFTGIVMFSAFILMIGVLDFMLASILSSNVWFFIIALYVIGCISGFVYAFWVLYLRLCTNGQARIYQTFLGNKWTYGLAWMVLGLQTYFAVFVFMVLGLYLK